MSDAIVNKVTESGLITVDLEVFYPKQTIRVFDLKEYLFMGLILKEKDFRQALSELNWETYRDQFVTIYCSADAIIPMWAYMLVSTGLSSVNAQVFYGREEAVRKELFLQNVNALDPESFRDKRVVIKGCGDLPIGEFAYVRITAMLAPVVKSLMYGEPCSTVPVFKRK